MVQRPIEPDPFVHANNLYAYRMVALDRENEMLRYVCCDDQGRIVAASDEQSQSNISDDSQVKSGEGTLLGFVVTTAGLGVGTIHDAADVASANTSNIIAVIPTIVANTLFTIKFTNGLVVKPSSNQIVSISYR